MILVQPQIGISFLGSCIRLLPLTELAVNVNFWVLVDELLLI